MEIYIVQLITFIDWNFLVILILALAGSYCKDYLRIMNSGKLEKLCISHILLSTLTATIVTYSISEIIAMHFGSKIILLLAFINGLLGFQLMQRLASVDDILELVKSIVEIIKGKFSTPTIVNVNVNTDKTEVVSTARTETVTTGPRVTGSSPNPVTTEITTTKTSSTEKTSTETTNSDPIDVTPIKI